jgi:hypothetical protein
MVSSPKPPDPYQTAAAQQQSDVGAAAASAIMNNPNRYSPYGSQVFTQAGTQTIYDATGKPMQIPRYNETTTLSPAEQQLFNLQTQTGQNLGQAAVQQSAKIGNYLNQGLNTTALTPWASYTQAPSLRIDQTPTDRAAVENAMMGRYNIDAATQQAQQDAQLAARGMSPGSAQYGQIQQARDRARTDALNQAYLASGQESRAAQDAYNQATQQQWSDTNQYATMMNQLRGNQLAEAIQLRNQPINEITALLGGVQMQNPNFPGFTGSPIGAAPIGSYINNAYQQQLAGSQATNQGLFNLGGAGIQAALTPIASGGMTALGSILPFI